jgi:hypothetical protein
MNFLFSPYAVSCGMKLVERRATRFALLKLESSKGEREEPGYRSGFHVPRLTYVHELVREERYARHSLDPGNSCVLCLLDRLRPLL